MSRRPGPPRLEPFLRSIRAVIGSTGGGTVIEYALIAALIAVVIIGGLSGLGQALRDLPMAALIAAFASVLS